MRSGSDPGTAPRPDSRAQVAALRETFHRHRFVLVDERSIQVTRLDDTGAATVTPCDRHEHSQHQPTPANG